MTAAAINGRYGDIKVLEISNQKFRKNRREYQGKLTYCPDCDMDYCPGYDGVDVFCKDCYLVQNCQRIEDQVGEYEFACLKRHRAYNDTLIVKTCLFCERVKSIQAVAQQIAAKTRLGVCVDDLIDKIFFIILGEPRKAQKARLGALYEQTKPKKPKKPNKKLLRIIRQKKNENRQEARRLKQEKKKRQSIILIAKVIDFKAMAEKLRNRPPRFSKKRQNRATQPPRTGCPSWRITARSGSFR